MTVTGMIPGGRYVLQESRDLRTWGNIEVFDITRVMPILRPMAGDRMFWRVGKLK